MLLCSWSAAQALRSSGLSKTSTAARGASYSKGMGTGGYEWNIPEAGKFEIKERAQGDRTELLLPGIGTLLMPKKTWAVQSRVLLAPFLIQDQVQIWRTDFYEYLTSTPNFTLLWLKITLFHKLFLLIILDSLLVLLRSAKNTSWRHQGTLSCWCVFLPAWLLCVFLFIIIY